MPFHLANSYCVVRRQLGGREPYTLPRERICFLPPHTRVSKQELSAMRLLLLVYSLAGCAAKPVMALVPDADNAIPLQPLNIRKCDSEREEWCTLEHPKALSALPEGGSAKWCMSVNAEVTDSWCIANCGFNPPNCPPRWCTCADHGPKEADVPEQVVAQDSDISSFARAFARPRLGLNEWFEKAKESSVVREQEKRTLALQAHADAERAEAGGAVWMHGRDDWVRRMESLRPKTAVVLEARPQRKCQSQWDGNCDRSAFQGKAGAKGKADTKVADVGPDPKWQIQVDPELLKTDTSGLPDGGDPATCVSIGSSMTDAWCKLNCGGSPPNCPTALCKCDVAKNAVVTKEALGKWGRCVGCYMARVAHAFMFNHVQ